MALISPTADLVELGNRQYRFTSYLKPVAARTNGQLLAMIQDWANGDATTPHIVDRAPLRSRVANDGMRRLYPIPHDDASYLEIGAPFVKVGGVWTQVSLGTPTRIANLITWTRPQTITRIFHAGHYVKLDIELRNGFVPEDSQVAFPVGLNGLTRSGVSILKDGAPVMQLRPLVVEDAANLDDVRPISHQFTTLNGQPYLLLTLPSLTGMSRPRIDPTLTLQPDGTAGIDTYVNEAAPTTAVGTQQTLSARSTGANRRNTLLKFDVSSIPAGSTINSATLTLWTAVSVGTTFTLNNILVANSAWVEGATWDYAVPSTVRWAGDSGADAGTDAGCTQSGTDYSATQLGTFTNVNAEAADTQYDITLSTAEVTTWLTANYGLVMRSTAGTAGINTFRSSDYATDATKRPQLAVDYTLAATGGTVFYVPTSFGIGAAI
jgi:hypothetical protein